MDLPVGLTADLDVVEVTGVVFGVGSSQEQLAAGFRVWVPDEKRETSGFDVTRRDVLIGILKKNTTGSGDIKYFIVTWTSALVQVT